MSNDTYFIEEIRSHITIVKSAFIKKKSFFYKQFEAGAGYEADKMLHPENCSL